VAAGLAVALLLGGRASAQAGAPATGAPPASGAQRVEKDLVYGMYSGLALLLDVHRPESPNGYGIVHVNGSAWSASSAYGAPGLKETQAPFCGPQLLRAGYTVFSVNHRGSPAFRYPGAVEDVQRAVRFVRANAKRFGIDPVRLGGTGGSSGGHLMETTALRRAPGLADDPDPVNRVPATVDAVVLRAGKFDLLREPVPPFVVAFMGFAPRDEADRKAYAVASAVPQVSGIAPPALLVHGDADDVVPYEESVALQQALTVAGVPARLLRIPGGKHGPDFGAGTTARPEWPDYCAEAVAWMDKHVKAPSR
jgi:acetyl esterase/lipase